VRELISQRWRPLVLPAGKAPEEAYRVFNDPSETLYTLLLAWPFLGPDLQKETDTYLNALVNAGLRQRHEPDSGEARVPYQVPLSLMRVVDDSVRDDLARLYPLWRWSRTPAGAGFVEKNWKQLRDRLHVPETKSVDDCGNSRLAGLIAYCRLAKVAGDEMALNEALPLTRQTMRDRLKYELAHDCGGVIRPAPNGRMVMARWRRLTPDVAALIGAHARKIEQQLMATYVDYHRPGWWLAWNVEQLMRNEAPLQLPTTPLEIFTARALLLRESPEGLRRCLDLPWCRADEFYIQKLALLLGSGVE
jgi:hypothetical protein